MPKQNDLEQKALHLIMNTGDKGVLQSELWREMKASSREGSRISLKLENKGLIHRERELSNGRWTYRLYSKKQPVSIDAILTCPCLICEENIKCGAGGKISPENCSKLTDWILESYQRETSTLGDN
ncbi:MAG: transcriptional regulator [Candidatus Bathyarchaeia archaeon]